MSESVVNGSILLNIFCFKTTFWEFTRYFNFLCQIHESLYSVLTSASWKNTSPSNRTTAAGQMLKKVSVFERLSRPFVIRSDSRLLVESGTCLWASGFRVPFQRPLNHRGPKLHSSHIKSVRVLFLSRHHVCFSSHVSFSELLKVCVLVWLTDSVLYLECDVVERQ